MKKIFLPILIGILAMVLLACSDKDQITTSSTTKTFSYNEFDLDVDYPSTKSYEASYEENLGDDDDDGPEASIEDDVNNEKLYGDAALDRLNTILSKLKIDVSMTDDDVITAVLKAFNLTEDYTEFELDVTFEDGTHKSFIRKK